VLVFRFLPEDTTVDDLMAAVQDHGFSTSIHANGKPEVHIVQREVLDPGSESDGGSDGHDSEDDVIPPSRRPKKFMPVVFVAADGTRSVTGLVQFSSVADQVTAAQGPMTINGVQVQPLVPEVEPVVDTKAAIDEAMMIATSMDRAQGNYLYLGCVVEMQPGRVEVETHGVVTTSRYMQCVDCGAMFAEEMAWATAGGAQVINRQTDADSRYLRLSEVQVLFQLKRQPTGRANDAQLMNAFMERCASFGNPISARFTVDEFKMFVSTPDDLKRPPGVSASRKLCTDPAVPFHDRFEPVEHFIGLRLPFVVGFAPVMGGIMRTAGMDAYHLTRNVVNMTPACMQRTVRVGSYYVLHSFIVACYEQLPSSGLTTRDIDPSNKTSQLGAVHKISRVVRDWIRAQPDGLGTATWLDVAAWYWKAMNDDRIAPLQRMCLAFRVHLFMVGWRAWVTASGLVWKVVGCTNQL
jgi:hypothetical protein